MNDQPTSKQAVRVLAVEDEAPILLSIEMLLEDASYSVSTASSAREALALLDIYDFHAAVLDLGLTEGTSLAVAEALKIRKIPFVFCTGSDAAGYSGYDDIPVIGKPFTDRDLLEAVGQVLSP